MILKAIQEFFERLYFRCSRLSRSKIFNLLMVVPATLAGLLQLKEIEGHWLLKDLSGFAEKYPLVVIAALALPPFILALTNILGDVYDRTDLRDKKLTKLLQTVDSIVGHKAIRFGTLARRLTDTLPSAGSAIDIFQEITQPREQILSIIEGVYHMFLSEVTEPESLFVTLSRIENGRFHSFEAFQPKTSGPRTSPDSLRKPTSAISRALEARDIVIIPDVERELKRGKKRRFERGPVEQSNIGSIIAYPVYHHQLDCIPYVITVKSATKDAFGTRAHQKKLYEYVLKQFANRLNLE
jgi:hypothetical protein